jgi:hypothetical protein
VYNSSDFKAKIRILLYNKDIKGKSLITVLVESFAIVHGCSGGHLLSQSSGG